MQVITGCGLPWARCSNKSSFSKTDDQSNEQINWTCPPCELLSPDDSWDGAAELPRERPGVQEKAPMGNGWMNKTIFHRCFPQHYQKMLRRKVASKQRRAQAFSVGQKMSPGSGFTRVKKKADIYSYIIQQQQNLWKGLPLEPVWDNHYQKSHTWSLQHLLHRWQQWQLQCKAVNQHRWPPQTLPRSTCEAVARVSFMLSLGGFLTRKSVGRSHILRVYHGRGRIYRHGSHQFAVTCVVVQTWLDVQPASFRFASKVIKKKRAVIKQIFFF